jgi:metallophosphoesterase (TIGR00282 family)
VVIVLDLFAINDLHGKFLDSDAQIGVDELTTYLKNAYETEDHVILLSSGDMWQGSSESNLTKGFIITEWMNELDFVSMTLGNHEYDWGETYVEYNATLAGFPFLAINIYDRETNERAAYCKSSVLVQRGGARIGIIGAMGDCYSSISGEMSGGFYFKTGRELTELVKAESERLRALGADLILANGENATGIHGLGFKDAHALWDAGVDLITLGNHTYGMRDIYTLLDDRPDAIIRPLNYPAAAPGYGYTVVRLGGIRVLVAAVSGRAFLDPLACPFETLDRILEREKGSYDVAILDVHAEATSEKLAIAYDFDGKFHVIFGTHTHVPTADERILPHGTGYITDLGMCGPSDGIIGTEAQCVIRRFRTSMPTRFSVAHGNVVAQGAIFDLDENAGRVRSVKRITF